MASNGPPGSILIPLSSLPLNVDYGRKVRFLGCVQSYDVPTGSLILHHDYPPEAPKVLARVQVDHVRGSMSEEEGRKGAWLNIVGYVQQRDGDTSLENDYLIVDVQAIMIWSAGAFKITDYELALAAREQALQIQPH